MKLLKSTVYLTILIITLSCSSSERVITEDGKVYNVNGNKIEKNGKAVNNDLNASEKEAIYGLVNQKKEIRAAEEKEIKAFEKAIEAQEQIEKNAKEKQRALKNQLDALNTKINKRQDVRDDYAKIKKNYTNNEKEFNDLKNNGKLSNIELKEWEVKLQKLKDEVAKAKAKL